MSAIEKENLVREVAAETNVDPDILYFLIGHNWQHPDDQVPEVCIHLGTNPHRTQNGARDILCPRGLAYVTSKLGKHRGPNAVNPVTNKKLSGFTFMTEKAWEEYGKSIALFHRRCPWQEEQYKLAEAEFLAGLLQEIRENLSRYSGFIGESVTLQGNTGILLRETHTLAYITNPNGLPLKIKKLS